MNLFILITLQAVLGGVSAAPMPDECLANQRTKLRSCNGFSVDGGLPSLAFLHAECHGFDQKAGKWNKVETGLDLNKCMVNVDGHLAPRENGYFAAGCEKEMNVVQDDKAGTVTFTATCNGNVKSSIELGDFITVKDGALTCFGLQEPPCAGCSTPERRGQSPHGV